MLSYIDPIGKLLGENPTDLNVLSIIVRLLLSVVVGGIIGAERSNKKHSAGLRTNIFVCLGACIVMIVNIFLNKNFADGNADASRLAAGVLGGIGFIGAGTILITNRNQITGLTTAAALFTNACIGIALGAGQYLITIIATVIVFFALISLPKLEEKFKKNSRAFEIHIELFSRPDLKKLLDYIRQKEVSVKAIAYDPAYANSGLSVYSISFFSYGKGNYLKSRELINDLRQLEYVHFVEEM